MNNLPQQIPAASSPPTPPLAPFRHGASERGGDSELVSVVVAVPRSMKSRWLKAKGWKRKFDDFIVDAVTAACEPRCSHCGSELQVVHPVKGDNYRICLVCKLRGELDDERSRVARLEAENDSYNVG